MSEKIQIAVVGATGLVGRELLSVLAAEGIRPEQVTALASERSVGAEVEFGEETLEVEQATAESFRGMGLALFATPPEVARALAPRAQQAGAWVVDPSAAFRADAAVPLVEPALNLAALEAPFSGRIVALASPVAGAWSTVLFALASAFGCRLARVSALLSVSQAGARGISELEGQVRALLGGKEAEQGPFPHRVGFNLIPQVGSFELGADRTSEERTWNTEIDRLLGDRAPAHGGTAIQAPTFFGHVLSAAVQLSRPAGAEEVRTALRSRPGVKVLDEPAERIYPMPMLVTGDPAVHVGRIRVTPGAPDWVELVAAFDNVHRAAFGAVAAGLRLARRG
jgi:aspartate-semialdehyde dehydrogenase